MPPPLLSFSIRPLSLPRSDLPSVRGRAPPAARTPGCGRHDPSSRPREAAARGRRPSSRPQEVAARAPSIGRQRPLRSRRGPAYLPLPHRRTTTADDDLSSPVDGDLSSPSPAGISSKGSGGARCNGMSCAWPAFDAISCAAASCEAAPSRRAAASLQGRDTRG
jgi:hypothetical protein